MQPLIHLAKSTQFPEKNHISKQTANEVICDIKLNAGVYFPKKTIKRHSNAPIANLSIRCMMDLTPSVAMGDKIHQFVTKASKIMIPRPSATASEGTPFQWRISEGIPWFWCAQVGNYYLHISVCCRARDLINTSLYSLSYSRREREREIYAATPACTVAYTAAPGNSRLPRFRSCAAAASVRRSHGGVTRRQGVGGGEVPGLRVCPLSSIYWLVN